MKIIDTRPIENLSQSNEILNIPLYDIKSLDQVISISKYENIIFQSPIAVKNFRCIKDLDSKRIISIGHNIFFFMMFPNFKMFSN